jgi:HD-GYP domain-containing protein (c-di-GMP phosphodiesterase class II)
MDIAVSDTKTMLQKIAALRERLLPIMTPQHPKAGEPSEPGEGPAVRLDPAHAVEEKVRQGAWHNRLIDRTLRPHDPAGSTTAEPALPPRLTASGARLLRKGRELLQALRALADEPAVQAGTPDPLGALHAGTVGMIDAVLRAVQAFPPSASEQLPLCEGLDSVLEAVEERVAALQAGLSHRKRETGHIDYLAEILRRLATDQPVAPPPLEALADTVVQEARNGEPLRFLHATADDPARFAAAHGLTVAQVLARLLLQDTDPQTPVHLAVMAALVHDVGMACVPADLLAKPGALTDEERRILEKHATAGGPMVAPLWPGGGWPIDAVTDHHERPDGTGYPLGRKDIQVAELVRLIAVCDVYAALCCPRPHRPAFDTRTALTETLLLAERDALDRQQAERLLLLSFFPAGSVVELSDGSLAFVLSAHPGQRGLINPARPIVLLLTDAQAHPLALPRVIDLVEERERSVVRSLASAERRRLLGRRYPELV